MPHYFVFQVFVDFSCCFVTCSRMCLGCPQSVFNLFESFPFLCFLIENVKNRRRFPRNGVRTWLRNGGSEEQLRNGVLVCVTHFWCLVVACASFIKTVTKLWVFCQGLFCASDI